MTLVIAYIQLGVGAAFCFWDIRNYLKVRREYRDRTKPGKR
jgi:hypothetical protein